MILMMIIESFNLVIYLFAVSVLPKGQAKDHQLSPLKMPLPNVPELCICFRRMLKLLFMQSENRNIP